MPTESSNRRPVRSPTALETVVSRLPSAKIVGEGGASVSGVEYDSRLVRPGDLFVALVGGYHNGHDFVADALARGAVAVLVERAMPVGAPQIVVPDTRAALAAVAAAFYGDPSCELDVIGVTGTDGKTTTTYLIEAIFRAAGRPTGLIGTVAVRIGDDVIDADTRQTTPESLDVQRHLRRMVDADVGAAVIEATSHGLDLHRLDEVRFVTGAVTNITHEHLEHHRTIAAYRRAKGILFERVGAAGGTAIVNLDDEGARAMLGFAHGARVMTYSIARADADLVAVDIDYGVGGTRFDVATKGERVRFETAFLGEFNVANCLCAVAVALAHDISLETSARTLATPITIPGRMQSIRAGQPFAVVVDYAHTPESIQKVLRLLRDLEPTGRLILVMGSAGERDRQKRPLQGAAAIRYADYAIFTSEDPRFEDPDAIIAEIAAGAQSAGGVEGRNFARFTDRREAIAHAFDRAEPGDCVVLAGKGHERSIIWGKEKRPWDEAAVATELLNRMGFAAS